MVTQDNKKHSTQIVYPRITSLKQLIILSFAFVLIPLVTLLWQTNQTLDKLAQKAISEPTYAIRVTRDINQLEKLALDIERVTRQYQIVQQADIEVLASNYFTRYTSQLDDLCEMVTATTLCQDNKQRLVAVAEQFILAEQPLKQVLADLRRSLGTLKQTIQGQLDDRLQNLQSEIEQVKTKQVWFSVALISLSFMLALLSSRKILAPVNKIERLIKELADKQHRLSPISEQGPVELINLERKLHLLAKRLEQLENLRQAMLRHASHELKTPLASIKEGLSLLSEQVLGGLNQQQREVLQLLDVSCTRLEKLIGQLLDYNTLLQQTSPKFEAIDIAKFTQAFITDHQLSLQQNSHKVSLKCEVNSLVADEILLRRIFDNLLSNAIAYGDNTSPIFIQIRASNSAQIIEFANAGNPIKDAETDILFKPFQKGSAERRDRISGSGLGLSIVLECATLMAGKVQFIKSELADVCVQVTLPLSNQMLQQEVHP